jgi:large conductance mechanosensitive channel
MWHEFKAFLLKQNLLALALAVVVGTATNSVVQSIVNGFIMPIVGLVTPGEGWRQFKIPLGPSLVERLRQAGADSATVAAAADSVRAVGGAPNTAQNALLVGEFVSALLNFLIVGFVAWQITRWIIKPTPPKADEKPATRPCPYCRQQIDAMATRCAYCTSQLEAAA